MLLKKQIIKISITSVPTIAQGNIGRGSRVSQTQEELAEAETDKVGNNNRNMNVDTTSFCFTQVPLFLYGYIISLAPAACLVGNVEIITASE